MNQVGDNFNEDWQALGQTWRSQPDSPLDTTSLRTEIARRSRRMAFVRALDISAAVVAAVLCVFAMTLPGTGPSAVAMYAGLLAVVVLFTSWVHWQRRRQWRAVALEPDALLAFELSRTRTSLRIWRVSVWLGCSMWCALTVQAILALRLDALGDLPAWGWALNIGANGVVLLVSAVIAWWLGRRGGARLQRLRKLAHALRSE